MKVRTFTVDEPDVGPPVTVRGFTCTGPGGASARWPGREDVDSDTFRTTRVRWLTATPPMFAVDFDAKDIHREPYDSTSVFRACEPRPMEDFVWLGDGRWAELKQTWPRANNYEGTTWTFHVDDVVLGTVTASEMNTLIAPAP